MKLRNKKTGDVWEFGTISMKISDTTLEKLKAGGMSGSCYADSIANLTEDWEDYKPAEPRIYDENARDAVYSWASELQINRVRCKVKTRGLGVEVTSFQACTLHTEPIIEFTSLDANVVDGGFYTITELCGEEEQ